MLSALSDRIGRKPVMVISSIGALICLAVLGSIGPAVNHLFRCLFGVHFFNNALIAMTVGPVAAETVPTRLMATASGVVIAAGELLGGPAGPKPAFLTLRDRRVFGPGTLISRSSITILTTTIIQPRHPWTSRRTGSPGLETGQPAAQRRIIAQGCDFA